MSQGYVCILWRAWSICFGNQGGTAICIFKSSLVKAVYKPSPGAIFLLHPRIRGICRRLRRRPGCVHRHEQRREKK